MQPMSETTCTQKDLEAFPFGAWEGVWFEFF